MNLSRLRFGDFTLDEYQRACERLVEYRDTVDPTIRLCRDPFNRVINVLGRQQSLHRLVDRNPLGLRVVKVERVSNENSANTDKGN